MLIWSRQTPKSTKEQMQEPAFPLCKRRWAIKSRRYRHLTQVTLNLSHMSTKNLRKKTIIQHFTILWISSTSAISSLLPVTSRINWPSIECRSTRKTTSTNTQPSRWRWTRLPPLVDWWQPIMLKMASPMRWTKTARQASKGVETTWRHKSTRRRTRYMSPTRLSYKRRNHKVFTMAVKEERILFWMFLLKIISFLKKACIPAKMDMRLASVLSQNYKWVCLSSLTSLSLATRRWACHRTETTS